MEIHQRHIWNEAPSRDELSAMAALLPDGALGLVSRRSTRAAQLGIDPASMTQPALLDLLAREPRLLRRPLITDGRRLVVGYDQDALQALAAGN